MNRLCIFAHYDKDNIIDDYVVYYLKALKEVCSTIIFVSDTESTDASIISDIADYCIIEKHGEYDFGSYKRGYFFAKNNNIEFDELLLVNDSCYGPFYPLKPIFDKMSKKKCDFWGLTQNRYGVCDEGEYNCPPVKPHIQSYFLLFKSQIFQNNLFDTFMQNVMQENCKKDIIEKYEIGLSQLLYKNGFKSSVFINKYKFKQNCTHLCWDKLISKDKYPLLKTSIVKNGFPITGEVKTWEECIKRNSNYPIEIISKNFERLKDLHENTYSKFNIYRKIRFLLLREASARFRYYVIILEKNIYLILNTICFNKLKKF